MTKKELLNTDVLPEHNCSNCRYFMHEHKQIVNTEVGYYAIECSNLTHPLMDCVLRGFEGHSEQPTFNQTINKSPKYNIISFGNFIRDNYYGVGVPRLISYNLSKYKNGTIEEIYEIWKCNH